MHTNTIRSATLAASILLAVGTSHALAGRLKPTKIAAKPAGVNALPGSGSTTPPAVSSPTEPGAPAAPAGVQQPQTPGAPGAPVGVQPPTQEPARPANPSGKPPVVIGPDGNVARAEPARVSTPGSSSAPLFMTPKHRGMRIGVSSTGGASANQTAASTDRNAQPNVNNAPPADAPVASFAIRLPSSVPSASPTAAASSNAVAASDGSPAASVHTWTLNGSTLAANPTSPADGVGHASPATGIPAGSSLTTSNSRANGPVALFNDMVTRIGGMGSLMPDRQAAVPSN